MNRSLKSFLSILLLVSNALHASDSPTFGKTFFTQRSQGSNLARWLAGQGYHTHLCDTDCINGSLAITPHYFQSYNDKELGQFFFFNQTNTMRFGPAGQPGVDVFARNLFLNDNFDGSITANPEVRNFVVDINFYLGLDEWVRGLYFRMDIPINWTSWDMRLTETSTTSGTTIAANKLGNTMAAASPRTSIIQALQGEVLDPTNFPDLRQEMRFARINGKQTKTGVADITFVLGYDFICNECGHLGFDAWVVAPTGTRPDAQFVFEPIVGNGRHVEVGGGISGHYELWNNGCEQSFAIFYEGFVNHMFRAKQKRTFDLRDNGIGSRYLLFKRFDSTGMYANEILFGPNVLTRDVQVRVDIHGEAAFMFDYQNGGFTFDVGYNIWGRTREHLTITENIPANTFGVAGNTDTAATGGNNPNNTQSLTNIQGNFAPLPDDGATPVFITTGDLNVESATNPGAVSHKLFTHLAYTWENCDYLPFLGLGGEVEFSGRNNRALDQWGIWVKGGFTFV
ncbi:MAG: hypothetical protein WDZ41_04565 [Candidatus Babeliales bacterium]